ncbi:MAG: hypothetical protein KatS3mg058_4583 [Roseiflexus sp.]|nr:MAG: hypothetical protein KatS3mg058_4583 [Roseiflexus sp.]
MQQQKTCIALGCAVVPSPYALKTMYATAKDMHSVGMRRCTLTLCPASARGSGGDRRRVRPSHGGHAAAHYTSMLARHIIPPSVPPPGMPLRARGDSVRPDPTREAIHAVIASRRRRRSNPLADVPGCAVTAPPAQPVEAIPSPPAPLPHAGAGRPALSRYRGTEDISISLTRERGDRRRVRPSHGGHAAARYTSMLARHIIPPSVPPPSVPVCARGFGPPGPHERGHSCCHCEPPQAAKQSPRRRAGMRGHCETGAAGRSHPLAPYPDEGARREVRCAHPSHGPTAGMPLRARGDSVRPDPTREAVHAVIARPAQPVEAISSLRDRRSRSKQSPRRRAGMRGHCATGAAGRSHLVTAPPAQPVEAIPSPPAPLPRAGEGSSPTGASVIPRDPR